MTAVAVPVIGWSAALPVLVLIGACVLVLLVGLAKPAAIRAGAVPLLTIAAFAVAAGIGIAHWSSATDAFAAAGSQAALRLDRLALALLVLVAFAGIITVLLAWRGRAPRDSGHGEFHALLLASSAGMVVLAAAQNMVTLFVGFELMSIPLYVLCAVEMRRRRSLESGLKYLIIGSLGAATLLYGLALLYGASGDTDLRGIAAAVAAHPHDVMVIAGVALTIVGFAFKAGVAPFHQWMPDVYEGAPTPITGFMAVAVKAAALVAVLRLFNVGLGDTQYVWAPMLAALATTTIIVGNVGALGQDSMKRLLAYSSVAQAGYLLAGIVAGTTFGAQAVVFYLAAYLVMNLAAFAVIVARERETEFGDSMSALAGLGPRRPLLAWSLTLAMLGLAGMPATAGFIGKVALIGAAADSGYTWLGVMIVIGSLISLGYYLKVIAVIWMEPAEAPAPATGDLPAVAGAEPAGEHAGIEVRFAAFVCAALIVLLGVLPGLAMRLAGEAARVLGLS